MQNSNYSKWASFFMSMCGKFGLKPHITGSTAARPTIPHWDQVDCCVCSWILDFVTDAVLDLTIDGDYQMTRNLWVTIEGPFRANKEPHAIFLNHEFHSMTQGDSSITDFFTRMKTVADYLRDVSHGVQESQVPTHPQPPTWRQSSHHQHN
ncbi:unnamed protein product [Urochloa humidicola]